ncbi:MAG: hypothetical protein KDC98_24995 [Planctomycetes bacterium]|nr:hypothetical protein [Planctomycetota bacterium]
MNHHSILEAATLVAILAAGTTAQQPQQPHAALFTPSSAEETRSGSAGTVLRGLNARTIAVVTPEPSLRYSAEKLSGDLGFRSLAGDEDGDGSLTNLHLGQEIDAVTVLPYEGDGLAGIPRTTPVSLYETFISPRRDHYTFVSGGDGLRKGDCGRFVRTAAGNGQVEYFITAEQIIAALNMIDPSTGRQLVADDINLDAITVSLDRHVYLSFADDHVLQLSRDGTTGNYLLADGAIAVIPGPTWNPTSDGRVAAVTPASGQIVFSESAVDTMVDNSNIADVTAGHPTHIDDTTGLAIDIDTASQFLHYWHNAAGYTNYYLDHLLISGESLSGCGVISTINYGSIGTLNAVPFPRVLPQPLAGPARHQPVPVRAVEARTAHRGRRRLVRFDDRQLAARLRRRPAAPGRGARPGRQLPPEHAGHDRVATYNPEPQIDCIGVATKPAGSPEQKAKFWL